MAVQPRIFTQAFRADALAVYRQGGRSFRRLAADLGLHESTLRNWYNRDEMKRSKKKAQQRASGTTPSTETSEEKARRLERENVRLQREVEQLKEDREILKKAAAFFAKESE